MSEGSTDDLEFLRNRIAELEAEARAARAERERAEEANERFRIGFEKGGVGQALTSIEGRFLEVNAALAKMLDYPAAELEGKTFNDVTHPDDRHVGTNALGLLLAGKDALRFEKRYLTRSGGVVWADVNVALARDASGEPRHVIGTFVDVTERKRAEHALGASERRYRRLFEAAKDGILILDADSGHIVDVNPYLLGLTGYLREDFLGKQLWEIGAFKDIAAARESFAQLQVEKYVRYEDLPLKARDGRRVDVEFVSNVYAVDGKSVIQCNIRDITARKQAETEHERLTTAIEQVAEIVIVTDVAGTIVYANRALETVTGYSRAEVLGENPRLLKSGVHDEAFYRELWGTIRSGQTWHGRMVNKKKDGTLYTEDSTLSPVRDAAGTITSFVAVKRDITQELVLGAQLLQSQKMEGIGRLAGGVAHDFNNLLSVILSYAEFAVEELPEDSPIRADLQEVRRAGERAAALTRQLLAFGRKQVLLPVPLDLNQVATRVEKMLRRILGEDVELIQKLAPDLGLTLADAGQIEQVLMNLVVNARDAMPEGGTLSIETANAELDEEYASRHAGVRPGRYVQLAVTDTGCGMDEPTRARLFEPFFTTKEKDKGTGLGLSTVYGIVKQSGGNIWVYSEPGQGTTFRVYLPRGATASAHRPSRAPAVPKRHRGTETLLVVEDEEALRNVAKRSLEAAGYTVLIAANGAEALLLSQQHRGDIHLLLTDVVMPRMNGKILAGELCKTRPTLAVVYMSGYSDEVIVHRGVLDEGTHFLGKPFTAADLTRKVREVLDAAVRT